MGRFPRIIGSLESSDAATDTAELGLFFQKQFIAVVWSDNGIRKGELLHFSQSQEPDAEVLGKWLKKELARLHITARKVAVAVPSTEATLRRITLPAVADEELPDLVRMQALTRASSPTTVRHLDYVTLTPMMEGVASREVLTATLREETFQDVSATMRAAGLTITSLGLSAFAAAQALGMTDEGLLLTLSQRQAEVTLVRDGAVRLAYSTELHGEDVAEDSRVLLGEIARAVVAADSHQTSVNRALLLGDENELRELAKLLAARYDAPVEILSSASAFGVDCRTDSQSLVHLAAAAGQMQSTLPPRIDFLHPRRRPIPPDYRRVKRGLYATAAALLVLLPLGWSWSAQAALDQELEQLAQRQSDLDLVLRKGEPTRERAAAMADWSNSDADWPGHLAAITALIPDRNRLILSNLTCEPGTRDSLGRIRGEGRSITLNDAQSFQQALANAGYRVSPRPMQEANRSSEYPIRFELELAVPRPTSSPSSSMERGSR